jgi:hypothetical protein
VVSDTPEKDCSLADAGRNGRCSALCGADNAYRERAPWWKHATLCPAYDARKGEANDRPNRAI